MNDRQALMVALAGPSVETETNVYNVLGIVFELLNAESEALLDYFDSDHGGYSRMTALRGRIAAFEAFVDNHVDVTFKAQNEAPVLRLASAESESAK